MSPPVPANTAPRSHGAITPPLRILLVEDDDGDALLVEEQFAVTGADIDIVRVLSLADAILRAGPELDCVLLDLDLPDAQGLTALLRLKEVQPDVAVLVLTGLDDEQRGVAAVGAGAQDYLVKGQIDGAGLLRAVRYAVERRRAEEAGRQLEVARVQAEENARLERGLLPAPLVDDPALLFSALYRPGRRRALLGGDFYDAVQDASGAVHAVIGDVSGHGPDEAALGVCLRIAWRTLVLGGHDADALLRTLQIVHDHERHSPWVFTTLCMATIAPDRSTLTLRLAGHPAPLLVSGSDVTTLDGIPADPPLGVVENTSWRTREHALPERWSLLLYTDGLVEGRTGAGPERLGDAGLTAMVRGALRDDPAALVAALVERAEELNGGPLLDDVAAFVVQRR